MNKINNYNKEEHIKLIEELIKLEQTSVFLNYIEVEKKEIVYDTLEYLYNNIEKLQQENTQLKSVLKEIRECIMSFFLTEEYIKVDGIAIANNYHELLEKIDKEIGEDK